MHESVQRLYDFAKRATAGTASPITGFPDLGAHLDVSSATLTNWKARGVSKDGALAAEAAFGCSAQWVLHGTTSALATREPPSSYTTAHSATGLAHLVQQLGAMLAPVDPRQRRAIASLLADLTETPQDAAMLGDSIEALARTTSKRTGT